MDALGGSAVGLAPLPDDPWTRGKCGLRLLQYLAAGVAAVASPVGVQAEILAGGAGWLATSEAEWTAALLALLADPAACAALATAGRARVEAAYSLRAVAPRLLAAWRRAVG